MLLFVMVSSGQAFQKWQEKLFNPGKLSQSHFLLQGQRMECGNCHRLGQKITNKDCQECHSEDWFSTKGKFYAQSHAAVKERECLECHIEHKGYDVSIAIPFQEQEHKSIPMPEREICTDCHLSQSQAIHPHNINLQCMECHYYNGWERQDMDHISLKPPSVSPSAPYDYCFKCHERGFHYTNTDNPDPIKECKPCHSIKKTQVLPPGY